MDEQINPQNSQPPKQSFFGGFSSFALLVWDFLKIIIIAGIIIVPIRYFVFQPFVVSGPSMEPNYQSGQYLIIDELSYHFSSPQRGQVIVFIPPQNRKEFYIKRIIGLPGETVKIDAQNKHQVEIFNTAHPEGEILHEPYLANDFMTQTHDSVIVGGEKTITLKADEYFALGDNRFASSDSRDWGPLKRSDIVGKVFVRVLPLNKFGVYTHFPSYGF
jgi:signal peptidase I